MQFEVVDGLGVEAVVGSGTAEPVWAVVTSGSTGMLDSASVSFTMIVTGSDSA